ncbi:MAG: nucleotidyltransferase domain-containing protein [Chloroflexota bacterium]|nr:nucleotidyltransferase domain-containing protein [Chloroflexota bacterium]
MNESLSQLHPNERSALKTFVARLGAQLTTPVREVWLFGSKARGDSEPDSDVDVLVILQDVDTRQVDAVHLIGARVSLEHDILLNTHIFGYRHWSDMAHYRSPLWLHVQCDGILLSDSQ